MGIEPMTIFFSDFIVAAWKIFFIKWTFLILLAFVGSTKTFKTPPQLRISVKQTDVGIPKLTNPHLTEAWMISTLYPGSFYWNEPGYEIGMIFFQQSFSTIASSPRRLFLMQPRSQGFSLTLTAVDNLKNLGELSLIF